MDEIYKALGWQGGTIHQIIEEIKRLKNIETKNDNEKLKIQVGKKYLTKNGELCLITEQNDRDHSFTGKINNSFLWYTELGICLGKYSNGEFDLLKELS